MDLKQIFSLLIWNNKNNYHQINNNFFFTNFSGPLNGTFFTGTLNKPLEKPSNALKLNRWTVGVTTAVAIVATIVTRVFG